MFNSKEINELMRYSYGSLGISGCATLSVMFVNGYNGMRVTQGTRVVKTSANNVTVNKETASIYNGFLRNNKALGIFKK